MRFSNRVEDDDGNMPVCTLPVDLVAAVPAGEERPEALALLESRLPSPYTPDFRSQLDLCQRVRSKVEVPRGVVLLTGIGRDHNDGLSFLEPEDRSGPELATLPPSCGEEDHRASERAAENPSARQPIDCSMDGVEDASGGQFPQHHIGSPRGEPTRVSISSLRSTGNQVRECKVNAELLAVRRRQFPLLDQDATGHSPSSFDILPAIVNLVEFEPQGWEQLGYGGVQLEGVSVRLAPVELVFDVGEEPFCGYCFGGS